MKHLAMTGVWISPYCRISITKLLNGSLSLLKGMIMSRNIKELTIAIVIALFAVLAVAVQAVI